MLTIRVSLTILGSGNGENVIGTIECFSPEIAVRWPSNMRYWQVLKGVVTSRKTIYNSLGMSTTLLSSDNKMITE